MFIKDFGVGGGGSLHPHGGSQPFPTPVASEFHRHKAHTWHTYTQEEHMNALIHKSDISKKREETQDGGGDVIAFLGL